MAEDTSAGTFRHSHDDREALARRIDAHVRALCAHPDRQPGTQANRDASAYVASELRAAGAAVEVLRFDVPEWTGRSATLSAHGQAVPLHPGSYSPAVDTTGRLHTAQTADELAALSPTDVAGGVLLVSGALAAEQFTPRNYPWYSNSEHSGWLESIERLAPAAVVAATDKNPAMTAALSPFPLIEDPDFGIPSAYCGMTELATLRSWIGREVSIVIDSTVTLSFGEQPVGRVGPLPGSHATRRVIVAGHLDSKWGSPGAIDNASGAAVVLALAERFAKKPAAFAIEFVPFNGEDHATSPGEVAYLAANPAGFSDVELMVNVDGAGFRGSPAALSIYAAGPALEEATALALSNAGQVVAGPEWFASDHAIFAMRGVSCLAVTSRDFDEIWSSIAHTHADVVDVVDAHILVDVVAVIERVIRTLGESG